MFVSKHWYAIELAKRGNKVYFLQPPNLKEEFKIEQLTEFGNLFLISGGTLKRGERFLPKSAIKILEYLDITRIKKKIGVQLDLLWDFHGNRFQDLALFGAKSIIFHPVDLVNDANQMLIAKKVDIIFSVSDIILAKFDLVDTKKKFINHGLNTYFTAAAEKILNSQKIASIPKVKKVGFVGNLLKSDLDRETFQTIIETFKDIEFYLIGAYQSTKNNLGGDNDHSSIAFVNFLQNQQNVHLIGPVLAKDIPNKLKNFDMLMMYYDIIHGPNKGSNSHKLLEYLSTGKVIVSNHISTYHQYVDLINMPTSIDNTNDYLAIFKDAILNISTYSKPEKQRARIELALANTYKKQVERIENNLEAQ